MKTVNRAPLYAVMYGALAQLARESGYALTIHGSMLDDLDLVAVPWCDAVSGPDELIRSFTDYLELCLDVNVPSEHWRVEEKPHGRKAWKLFLDNGLSIDVSIMPTG